MKPFSLEIHRKLSENNSGEMILMLKARSLRLPPTTMLRAAVFLWELL